MILALYEQRDGVETGAGNRVVYSLARNEAFFGAARVEGHTLRWELADEDEKHPAPKLSAAIELDPQADRLIRCDRVDFPPDGVAYLHTHPGPGIRYLLHGSIRIESGGVAIDYGPGDAWFESGPEPVYAAASESEETAFVRVMLLPAEWAGKRTIRYVNPEDEHKPKLQRATVFVDEPIVL